MADDDGDDQGGDEHGSDKAPDAFRTISEVAGDLELPQHVLRFWETRFRQIRPLKRGGGRRYYRPEDVELLRGIRHLLYGEGYTIRGVQRILREQGLRFVAAAARGGLPPGEPAPVLARADDRPEELPAPRPRRAPRRSPAPGDDDGAGAMAQRLAGLAPAPEPRTMPAPTLAPDDLGRLEATLSELLECKRLLDQAR